MESPFAAQGISSLSAKSPALSVTPSTRSAATSLRVARRIRLVYGLEGSTQQRHVDALGSRTGACASQRRWSERAIELPDEIECNKFIQFEFERQWRSLKAHCGRNDIRIMGDMPIYVALDSADVWANRGLFQLDENGQPKSRSGRAPRLLQRHRPTMGQSHLSLGGAREERICMVDCPLPSRARGARHDSPRPLPRICEATTKFRPATRLR